MKTHNHLWEEITSFENLWWAVRRAERGKRLQAGVGRFRTNVEAEVLQLRRELLEQTYMPGAYREKMITRPKTRMISAAPFRARENSVNPNSEAGGQKEAAGTKREKCWNCPPRKHFTSTAPGRKAWLFVHGLPCCASSFRVRV